MWVATHTVKQGMMVLLPGDEGDPVPAKKRSATAEKELKATVKKLRSKLEKSDAKAAHWKKKTAQLEKTVGQLEKAAAKSAAKSDARVAKLTKRLEKPRASRAPQPAAELAPEQVQTPSDVASDDLTDDTAATTEPQSAGSPDASWTVVQLRAEARARGLTGLSNKSKAQLLDALG